MNKKTKHVEKPRPNACSFLYTRAGMHTDWGHKYLMPGTLNENEGEAEKKSAAGGIISYTLIS